MARSDQVLRVIIVDDEQLIADTLAMILRRTGFKAWASYSGEDAVEMAARIIPDVLVTDVVMPGISGIETAIRINEMHPGCTVLLFSGQASTLDLLSKYEVGSHSFQLLPKPLHPLELIERLNGLAEKRCRSQAPL